MTNTAPVPEVPTVPAAPPLVGPAPADAAPSIDYAALAKAIAAESAAPAAAAPAPVADPAPTTNQFTLGQVVKHSWTDPYDGDSSRYGIVVELVADDGNGSGAKSVLAWLGGGVSGPIGDQHLTAV